jgi:hypothetical protein
MRLQRPCLVLARLGASLLLPWGGIPIALPWPSCNDMVSDLNAHEFSGGDNIDLLRC